MINNKAPWIGPDVEWHQEVFNIDTYAPGGNANVDSWKDYLQIYIALDPHTLENGCLKVYQILINLDYYPMKILLIPFLIIKEEYHLKL